ncbi:MAG: hypothetical protein POELPBGB_03177 [Bacteroidia bacterium]|nr:hypothetical protein [Bacteroidia bacterium]
MWQKSDTYTVETHPFETFIPAAATHLIIGTFPTHQQNFTFNFYYSGENNNFWKIIEEVFNHKFKHSDGDAAVEERKKFLTNKRVGITDMIIKCYRRNNKSTDENLFPIILQDVFSIIDNHKEITTLVLTSRTEVFGALGLLKTYFLQRNLEFGNLERRSDKVMTGNFKRENRIIDVVVPYSPSYRLTKNGKTTNEELVKMYKSCLVQ